MFKILKSFAGYVALWIFILSCSEDEAPNFPIRLELELDQVEVVPLLGVVFSGSIENFEEKDAMDYGVIWLEGDDVPTIGNSNKKSLKNSSSEFGIISFELRSLKNETDYTGRIYVETSDNVYYSNSEGFTTGTTAIPEILSISAEKVHYGDTIVISGSQFGIDRDNISVLIANSHSEILFASDSLIQAIIPYFFDLDDDFFLGDNLDIVVKKYDQVAEKKYVDILAPEVTSISTNQIYAGYALEIIGKGFHPSQTKIFFGDTLLQRVGTSHSTLNFDSPILFASSINDITVTIGNKSSSAGLVEVLAPKVINDFNDLELYYNNSYTLKGENLDNTFLEFYLDETLLEKDILSNEEVIITFPSNIGKETYDLSKKLSKENLKETIEESKVLKVNIPTIQPQLSNFQVSNLDFGAEITVDLSYTPSVGLQFFMNGIEGDFGTTRISETSAKIILPNNFIAEDGWLSIEMRAWELEVTVENVFQFPEPVLEVPSFKLQPFQGISLPGMFLAGAYFEVYLNDELIANKNGFAMSEYPDGTYTLSVIVNGQSSNEVQVEVINTWEQISELVGINASTNREVIFEIANNKLYFCSCNLGEFYAMDLSTGQITELSPLPEITGGFTILDDFGYLNKDGKVYRYDILNDTWEFLSQSPLTSYTRYTFVARNGKLFLFAYPISGNGGGVYFTYEFDTNEWEQHTNGPSALVGTNVLPLISDGDIAYIFVFGAVFTFDLVEMELLNGYFITESYRMPSIQNYEGIKHLDELFMISGSIVVFKSDGSAWPNGSKYQYIGVPGFSNLIAGQDGYAYTLGPNGIWRYDIELAK